jgi:hypothetical protein
MISSLRRVDPVLWAILLLALALRAWGLGYGLPHVYNPDEVSILSRALSLGGPKGLNPGNFVYPSLFLYVLAAAMGACYVVQRLLGQVGSLAAFERAFWQDPSTAYLVARSISVAAGVFSVAATYALARKVGGRTLARSAALLMAVAYIPVRDAHMVKHDVMMTLMAGLVVLAAWAVLERGRLSDYARAGGLAGVSLAMHYYSGLSFIPILVAHALRTGLGAAFWKHRGIWIAAGLLAVAFAVLSPYVLIEYQTTIRDIASNNEVLFVRTQAEYGAVGAGRHQIYLLMTLGAGILMTLAALVGAVFMVGRSWRVAALLFAFPVAFSLMLIHTWPYGRLQNVLYPFIAIAAAAAIDRWAARAARPARVALALTMACAAQPLAYDILLDRLLARTDTRTDAAGWIAAHVPAGSGIAVEVYSVPLEPTRDWLQETIARLAPGAPLGSRARGLLDRDPYPAAAYRLFYLGPGGLDKDKAYLDPADVFGPNGLSVLRRNGVAYVVIKERLPHDADARRAALKAGAALVYRASPFADGVTDGEAQLPDYDVRPSLDVTRPGPAIEVWRLAGRGDGH